MIRALLLSVLLAGCATPSTVDGLRKDPAGREQFEISKDYQAVYRAIVEQARRCHQGNLITAQMQVQSDLYTDTKSGHVAVQLVSVWGPDVFAASDIASIGENRTRVATYYAVSSWKSFPALVERWVNGSTSCS